MASLNEVTIKELRKVKDMSEEARIFEYEDIIIPLNQNLREQDLIKASEYPLGSKERSALTLAAELKDLHVQYLKLHIEELKGFSDKVQDQIKENKKIESEVSKAFYLLDIDVRKL